MIEQIKRPGRVALLVHAYLIATLSVGLTLLCILVRPYTVGLIFLCIFSGLLLMAYFLYFGYGVFTYAKHTLEEGDKSAYAKALVKNKKVVSKAISALFGSIINYAMGLFYLVTSIGYGTYFYVWVAAIYLFAFSARITLLFVGIEPSGKKEAAALFFSSIFSLLIGLAAFGIALYVQLGKGEFQRHNVLLFVLVLFTLFKLLLGISSFFRLRKKKSLLLASYVEIGLSLAFFSLFVLLFEAFHSAGINDPLALAIPGYLLSSLIIATSVFGFITAIKGKKEEEPAPEPEPDYEILP